MWPVMSEDILLFFAVIFTAISVKLTDDYLDQDIDKILGKLNFVSRLGKGTPIYGLLSLAIGAALSASISLSLFFACYIIGMTHDSHSHYPLGMNGLQESLAVLIVSCCLLGLKLIIFSLLFVFAVQLFDDWLDIIADDRVGMRNYACSLGRTECFLLMLICLVSAFVCDREIFFPVLLGFIVTYSVIITIEGGKSR